MRLTRLFILVCMTPLAVSPAHAQEPVQAREAAKANISGGLRWLAGRQDKQGAWGSKDKLALTGMSGLALLASGSTPQRGPYAEPIRRAIAFVIKCQKAGDPRTITHASNGYSAIHNHGYALLFLTQAYGEGGPLDEELRRSISLAVKGTIGSQFPEGSRSDGGFGYFLYRKVLKEHANMWKDDEASTTISQIQALRGARNAGFKVRRKALERAGAYIARSQHSTGGFHYSIGSTPPRLSMAEGSNRPTFAITAACTAVLHALGTYQGGKVDAGVAYVEGFIPPNRKKIPFFYYAHYYAAQVMHMVGGTRADRWRAAIEAELGSRQRPDGRWAADPKDTLASRNSEILNTAWSLQILLLERGMLPLHER